MIIREIETSEINKVKDFMVDSFLDTEIFSFIIKEEKRRKNFLDVLMKNTLKEGIRYGKVYITDNAKAVSVWVNSSFKKDVFSAIDSAFLNLHLTKEEKERFLEYVQYKNTTRDIVIKDNEYWMLSLICVAKEFQQKGYGTALLKYGANITKRTRRPCFLETHSKEGTKLYQKIGYKLVSETTIPNTVMTNYLMKLI